MKNDEEMKAPILNRINIKDILESDQNMLDVDGGNYSVHLAKIPETTIIINRTVNVRNSQAHSY
ncbi:hypothetical protein [Bacillus paralicheniformis]|uniref:hypothetical protein n=1 Tax=Bacillus paralicheniformis TaxID=1648923 RepID=UPI00128B56D6|nr:hypothetical protein [Bacillus paralicheniformis]MPQ25403.1 hypothetical protein [Bacillus paralicheniformis]